MNINLPTVTAREATLPGGQTVWVQTANALHRELAQEAADLHAAREARPYRKGGEGYEAIKEQFEDGGIEFQVSYLAEDGWLDGSYQREADSKFPLSELPPRKDGETDDAFDKRVAAWDEQSAKVASKRAKHLEAAYEKAKAEASALSDSARIEKCCTMAYQRKRRNAFATRFVLELLARSVRQADNHAMPYYASADAVADLPDDERDVLITAYFAADPVKPEAIPT